jgi:DNA (cytosine-5)-methyltransferase 1
MNSIELFAGAGGLAIGLEESGFHPKKIVEFNKDACKTLRANELFDYGANLYEGDIANFDFMEIEEHVDLVSGGPPCQPFSLGGKAKGHKDNRDMFPQAVRSIREKRPRAFIFENVKGLLRKSFFEYFEYILLRLQYPSLFQGQNESWESHRARLEQHHTNNDPSNLEYKVVYRLINAADYGVPQKRERVFIIGFRADIDANWTFPTPTHSEDVLLWSKWVTGEYWKRHGMQKPRPDEKLKKKIQTLQQKYGLFEPELFPWVTVRDALNDLPEPTADGFEGINQHIYKGGAKIYPGHTGSYIDEPSKALKAGDHGVPGGENMIRFEDGSVRYLSVRESARIQTFPDDFLFEGSWGEVMRQLGNAVPAYLAKVIGQSVFRALSQSTSNKIMQPAAESSG